MPWTGRTCNLPPSLNTFRNPTADARSPVSACDLDSNPHGFESAAPPYLAESTLVPSLTFLTLHSELHPQCLDRH